LTLYQANAATLTSFGGFCGFHFLDRSHYNGAHSSSISLPPTSVIDTNLTEVLTRVFTLNVAYRQLQVICEMRNCERVICETGCETRSDWSAKISIFRRLPCITRASKLCNLRNGKRENANAFTYCCYATYAGLYFDTNVVQ